MGFEDQMARFEKRLAENLKKIDKKLGDNVGNMFNSSNSFSSNSNSSITINGITIQGGNNVTMKNGEIWVDGVKVDKDGLINGAKTNRGGFLDVTIEGIIGSLTVDNADKLTVGNVGGNVEARNGVVTCGDVKGSIEARNGMIQCGNVGGNVSSRNGDVKYTVSTNTKPDQGLPLIYVRLVEEHYLRGGKVLEFRRIANGKFEQSVISVPSSTTYLDWDSCFYSIQLPKEQKTTTSPQQSDFCEIKE